MMNMWDMKPTRARWDGTHLTLWGIDSDDDFVVATNSRDKDGGWDTSICKLIENGSKQESFDPMG
jgi:hypothetical protein